MTIKATWTNDDVLSNGDTTSETTSAKQTLEYIYALECALEYAYSQSEAIHEMIRILRKKYAPDLELWEIPSKEDWR